MSRSEYSDDERHKILWYIIKNDRYLCLRGNTVWKDMEHDKICERTWQSMKSHFQNKIINNLYYYNIPQDKKDQLLNGYKSTRIKKKTKDGRSVRLPVQKIMIFSSDEEECVKPVKQTLLKRKLSPDKLKTESSDDSTDLLSENVIRYSNKEDTNKRIDQLNPGDLYQKNQKVPERAPKIAKVTQNLHNSPIRNTNFVKNVCNNKHIFPSTSRVENILTVDVETKNQVQNQKNVESSSKSCKTSNKEHRNEANNCMQVQEIINDINENPRTLTKCIGFEEEITHIQPKNHPETIDQFVQAQNSTENKSTQLEINERTSNNLELNLLGDKFVKVKIGEDNHIFASASDMNQISKDIIDVLTENEEKIHIVTSETLNLLKDLQNINSACVQNMHAAVSSKELDFSGLKPYLTQMEDILNKVKETHFTSNKNETVPEQTSSRIVTNSDLSQNQNKPYSSSNSIQNQKINTLEPEEMAISSKKKMTSVFGIAKINLSKKAQKYNSPQEIKILDISKEPQNATSSKPIETYMKINNPAPELLKYLISTEPQKLDNLAGIRINQTSEYDKRSFDTESNKNSPQIIDSLSKTCINPPELNLANASLKNAYTSPKSQNNKNTSQTSTESQNNSPLQTSKTTTSEPQNPNTSKCRKTQEFQISSAQNSNKFSNKQNNSRTFPETNEPNSQNLASVPMEEDVDMTKIISLLNVNQMHLNESIDLPSTCESEAFYTAQSQDLNVTNN